MDDPIPGQTTIEGPQQLDFLGVLNFSLSETETLKLQLKTEKERLESELLQHNAYVVAVEAVKELSEKKKSIKEQALSNPICQEISAQIKELQGQLKEARKSLSLYALQYVQNTGKSEFRSNTGEVVKVKATIKIKSAKN